MRIVLTIVAVLAVASSLAAQSQLAFDGVSIRENRSASTSGGGGPRADGRYVMTNVTTRSLISIAYEIPGGRVLGGPAWLDTSRYDVAGIGKEKPSREEAGQMLRSMLRDRFQLAARVEKRDLPVYHLVLARSDGQLGPNVRPAAMNCDDMEAVKKAFAAMKESGGRIPCGISFAQTGYVIGGERMTILEQLLSTSAGRPVLDRTGLTGRYDIDFEWTRADADRPDGISLFTALGEQLGLKLDNATAPLDVVVIERIERPSEN